jgi:hypothetical protein
MPSRLGPSSNVYWLRPTTSAKGRVVSQLGRGDRLMWIISSNWRTAVRTVKAIFRSSAERYVTPRKVEIVMQTAVKNGVCTGIWQDGRNVVDFVDGDGWTVR